MHIKTVLQNLDRTNDHPRRFVPLETDLADWSAIEPLFRDLENRTFSNVEDFTNWILDRDELIACLWEENIRRILPTYYDVNDTDAEQQLLHMSQEIWPRVKPIEAQLTQIYLDCPFRSELDPEIYEVYDRMLESNITLFHEDNVALEQEEAKLRQEYDKIRATTTIHYQGQEYAIGQAYDFLTLPDRQERETVWHLIQDRMAQDRDRIDEIFSRMVQLRDRIARNAGFTNYLEYGFRKQGRYDYTPADCVAFHAAIETSLKPFIELLDTRQKRGLDLATLRPWDMDVDAQKRVPVPSFKSVEDMVIAWRKIYHAVDPAFGELVDMMQEKHLLELEGRPGKLTAAFSCYFADVRLPFIFMSASGTEDDFFTLLHEGGHSYHSMACRDISLYDYRANAGGEISEFASNAMISMCLDKLSLVYDEADATRLMRWELEHWLKFFLSCMRTDAFQHWVYQHPNHTSEERAEKWLELERRFCHDVDINGIEETEAAGWQSSSLLFANPLMMIEYAIALIGVLQFWKRYRHDPADTVYAFKQALALGGSRPLPELFETAGLRFDFSQEVVEPVLQEVQTILASLPE